MAAPAGLKNLDFLKHHSAGAGEAFQALRQAVSAEGPLDAHTCELIALATLAVTGEESSFKVHARRLLKENIEVAALRQAVLVTFGVTTTFSQIVTALRWIDALEQESSS